MKLEQVERLAILAAVAVGGFAVYRFLNGATNKLASVGEAIGSGLYDLLHPNEMGEVTFYLVTFPDNVRHSIPSSWVNASGRFVNRPDPNNPLYKGDGKTYQIVKSKTSNVMRAYPV